MAKRKQVTAAELPPPCLLISKSEATKRINDRITQGVRIRDLEIRNESDFEDARAQRNKWNDFNVELLSRIFNNASMADEYRKSGLGVYRMNPSFAEQIETFRKGASIKITQLESIKDRLELIDEIKDIAAPASVISETPLSGDIFVVHGHDEAAKESISRFLEKLDLNPIILHEKPNQGRTIIEKFEDYADVGFAVILLTPDDVGYQKDRPEEKSLRARQNVIIELGYFLGKLGRKRVCALHKKGTEIPSDYNGVLFVPLDDAGAWKLTLAREIKEAKIPIDLNKVI